MWAVQTLTGMKKHVGVLEQAGLATTEKIGRVRTCRLGQRGLEEEGGRTVLVLRELYPSKEALDGSFVGMEDAMPEQFEQLDALLAGLGAKA